MLGSLDNEIVFKKAFTDKFVFEHFVNLENEGIKKASELISYENLTPAERTAIKQAEGKKVVLQLEQEKGFEKGKIEEKINNIITLLTIKLGLIPKNIEEEIKKCSNIEKLDNIIKNVFNFDSFDEIEKILE